MRYRVWIKGAALALLLLATVADTFAGPAIVSISVPHDWPAAAAVTAVARRLGLDV